MIIRHDETTGDTECACLLACCLIRWRARSSYTGPTSALVTKSRLVKKAGQALRVCLCKSAQGAQQQQRTDEKEYDAKEALGGIVDLVGLTRFVRVIASYGSRGTKWLVFGAQSLFLFVGHCFFGASIDR
ncbi:hypothetical protein BKA81DRAFT_345751 [Phyllosticta paracitricarpa]